VRKSDTTTLFGRKVSLYATEEDALCALFAPLLNRAVFPDMVESGVAQIDNQAADMVASSANPLRRIAEHIYQHLRLQDEGTQDDMRGQMEAYTPENIRLLERMLELVSNNLLNPEHKLKLIRGYRDQLPGCNEVTTLGFGILATKPRPKKNAPDFKPNTWVARIYLTDKGPRIALPLRFLPESKDDSVKKTKDSFSPCDVEAFLGTPSDFIVMEPPR
jgi:hypothetical protein